MSPLTSFGRHDRFGRLCNQALLKTLRFSLQRHKAQEFFKAEFLDSMPVFALECFSANETGIFFRGFGLGRLVSWGILDAKAVNRTGVLIGEFSAS